MKAKKQLVIIPPMSEALNKLNEVLEGIATDENIEISIIDDLKELSQFIATTGQCLILNSNAKKCAQFLQENRLVIAKSHAKVILLTPKEIPAKTLVKFTKIGLTESILENSPPKTLLYKVKLLLRSIKSASSTDEADREVVKSFTEVLPQINAEENQLEDERSKALGISKDLGATNNKVNAEENVIDYSSNMKGKIRPQEESIDTNWKSDRKKDITIDLETEGDMRSQAGDQESIDMYYRNKRKKEVEVEVEELDAFGRLKKLKTNEEEAQEEKKRNSMPDIIDEGMMKEKRLNLHDSEEESDKKEKRSETELTAGKKEKKLTLEELEAEFDSLRTKNKNSNTDIEEVAPELDDTKKEDLGGYLKGKLRAEETQEAEEDFVDKTTYDNSDVGADDPDNIELDLLAGASKKKKAFSEEESTEGNIHDGVVDHIENNMFGDEGTVEQIRTHMLGKSGQNLSEEEEELDALIESLKKKALENKDEDEDESSSSSPDLMAAEENNKKNAKKSDAVDEKEKNYTPSIDLNLKPGDKKSKSDTESEREAKEREHSDSDSLEAIEKDHLHAKGQALEEEKGFGFKKLDDSSAKEKRQNDKYDGSAEKIDTYMRGGKAKKTDHSWDNLTDRSDTMMAAAKGKRAADGFSAMSKKCTGEESVIDYRKLKEEFDILARTNLSSPGAQSKESNDSHLKNDEDNGSFRVIEIDPKSLDFSINIQNAIYQKEIKAKQIFKMIATELLEKHHAASIFYTYKLSDKKFNEAFNIFNEAEISITENYKDKWTHFKKSPELFTHYQELSMTTWRCPEIINDGIVWEDVELPSWAGQELTNKSVELIFPYFDGLDRMGLALVFLPEGMKPQQAEALLVLMELARTLLLDTIERYKVVPLKEVQGNIEEAPLAQTDKKNIVNFFSGLFGRKKAG